MFGEPGVFVAFEERPEDLAKNVSSLGYSLDALVEQRLLAIDHVRIERNEIEETGEYDLEGLFIRLGYAIDTIGAKRVVIDTVETLFGGLSNASILRAELRRLFEWLKDRGVTAVITGERGDGQLTRHGLEEYVSDCVILLDHRVVDQLSTRRLRIVKYRGSSHGTNEYPFLIDHQGISVIPISGASLNHPVSEERVSTGVPELDEMLSEQGYFRGSSVLVSGMAGTGKSTMASHFVDAACRRGERCLYFAFEEAPAQIVRNMRSVGLDLEQWTRSGVLQFSAQRPSLYGLEMHLAVMHREVERFRPHAVVVDPMSALLGGLGASSDVSGMLLRMIDFLKARQITALYTNLTRGNVERAVTEAQVSSLMDTWLLLYNRESNGEHNRELYLLKSRGMAHSNQVREFQLTSDGIRLEPVYVGPDGVLTGSARVQQEAKERFENLRRRHEIELRQRQAERRRRELEAQIRILQAQLESEADEAAELGREATMRDDQQEVDRREVARSRGALRTAAE